MNYYQPTPPNTPNPQQTYLNAATVYSEAYQNYYKEYNQEKGLKRACNGIGGLMLIVLGVQLVVTIVLEMVIIFSGGLDYSNLDNGYSGMDPMGYFLLLGLSSLLFCVLPALIYAKIKHERLLDLLRFQKVAGKTVMAVVAAGLCVCMYANMITQCFSMSMKFFFGIDNQMASVGTDLSTPEIVLFCIAYALVPCLTEEFLFRGVMLSMLRKYGDAFAILSTALLFGMLHGNFVQIPFAFIVGLVLGYAVCYTNSMLPAIIIHFFNNFFAVVMTMIAGNTSEKVGGLVETIYMIFLLVIGFIGFAYLAKSDKSFMAVKNTSDEVELSSGKKMAALLTSVPVIIFIIIMFALAAFTLLYVSV